jgi:hypothetical protein
MAIELYNWLSPEERAFDKNDGSPEQRLYTIGNHIKAHCKCVKNGQIAEAEMLPFWVDAMGLRSYEETVATYAEAASVLRGVAGIADRLQNPAGFASHRDQNGR